MHSVVHSRMNTLRGGMQTQYEVGGDGPIVDETCVTSHTLAPDCLTGPYSEAQLFHSTLIT